MGEIEPHSADRDREPVPQIAAPAAPPSAPVVYAPPAPAIVVETAPLGRPGGRNGYQDNQNYEWPEHDDRPRSQVWETVKWPLRKLLLGVYLVSGAARRNKKVTIVVSSLLLALIATAIIVYAGTRPAPPPVAIDQAAAPPLAVSVIHYLHGQQHFDGQEMWSSLDSTAQQQVSSTEASLQSTLNQEKASGVQVTRFVYSGGYQPGDGTTHYTVEVYATLQGQTRVFTWYFVVGTSGLITTFQPLS